MQNRLAKINCTNAKWVGRADCQHCGVRNIMLFADLEEPDFDLLLEPIDNIIFPQRQVVYNQGDECDAIYSIRRGLVKLEQVQMDGSKRIVRLLGPGACFGLESMVEENYKHNAIAMEDLDVCRIPALTMQRLDHEQPRLHEQLIKRWEQNVEQADRYIVELSTGSVKSRLIRLLQMLAGLSTNPDQVFVLPSGDDMAAMVGTTLETVSRTVADMKRNHLITKIRDSQYKLNAEVLPNA